MDCMGLIGYFVEVDLVFCSSQSCFASEQKTDQITSQDTCRMEMETTAVSNFVQVFGLRQLHCFQACQG